MRAMEPAGGEPIRSASPTGPQGEGPLAALLNARLPPPVATRLATVAASAPATPTPIQAPIQAPLPQAGAAASSSGAALAPTMPMAQASPAGFLRPRGPVAAQARSAARGTDAPRTRTAPLTPAAMFEPRAVATGTPARSMPALRVDEPAAPPLFAEPTGPSAPVAAVAPDAPAETELRHEFAIPPFASSAATLAVNIAGIENPLAQAFSVRAWVCWSGDGQRSIAAEIGRFVPPVTEGAGTYLLALSAPVRELLSQRDGQLRLRLRLLPLKDRTLHQPLHVRISEPRWY